MVGSAKKKKAMKKEKEKAAAQHSSAALSPTQADATAEANGQQRHQPAPAVNNDNLVDYNIDSDSEELAFGLRHGRGAQLQQAQQAQQTQSAQYDEQLQAYQTEHKSQSD